MKATLVMNFRMTNGKNTTVSITSPKDELTKAEVAAVAAEMVEKDALILWTTIIWRRWIRPLSAP